MTTFKEKIIRCLKNTFYVWGITFFPSMITNASNLTPEIIYSCTVSSLLTAGLAFFVAYRIVFKSDIIEEAVGPKSKGLNKKGKCMFSSILLF